MKIVWTKKVGEYFIKISTLIIISLLLIFCLELFSRYFLEESMYLPGPMINNVQSHLKLNSSVGFLWKENINYSDNILLPWSDQITSPLSTDSNGFRNHPDAIISKQKVSIVGLGDSFIHDASYSFYEYFSKKGIHYYNLAMHRHSPPQYNLILKEYALSKNPDLIIYGIFENDFYESIDFMNWRKSGKDWFTYHSGVWGGAVAIDGFSEPFSIPYFKGIYAFYRMGYNTFRNRINNEDTSKGIGIVYSNIIEAFQIAQTNKIGFLLVLIPSKETLINGKQNDYDKLLKHLENTNIPIIDLRNYFSEHKDIEELYYKIDGHWNDLGIKECARIIYNYITESKYERNYYK